MKAVLLRVGIDKGYGFLSPVFQDLSFRYIPIYYKNKIEVEKNEKRDYYELSREQKNDLIDYVPQKYKRRIAHYDPEFETYTYGEPNNPKRGALLKLTKGDLLIFYLGGELHLDKDKKEIGCFIFGYFEVDKVYEWNRTGTENKQMLRDCNQNAHIRSSKSRNNLVIVKGTQRSKLLEKCIYFTKPNKDGTTPYITQESFTKKYSIRKNVVRATPQTIVEPNYIKNIKSLLNIKY
ncbi:MAG: hypothetical protein RBR74_04435 [Ignavibacteriaceae bacterium]|jgi:hypothetical protein|nr:hypothetical protein [Ignavibacteriaceae bacterium]